MLCVSLPITYMSVNIYFLNELFQMKQFKKSQLRSICQEFQNYRYHFGTVSMKQSDFNLNQNNTGCIQLSRWITTDPMNYFWNFKIGSSEEKNNSYILICNVALTQNWQISLMLFLMWRVCETYCVFGWSVLHKCLEHAHKIIKLQLQKMYV